MWSPQLEPPRPCVGMEAGGAVAPGLQSKGADTDLKMPRPSSAALHTAAASARPGLASCSRGRCHPLELSLSLCHHRLRGHRLAAALPAPASFLRPFPGLSAQERSQSPPAAAATLSNRSGLPAHPHCPAPGVTHWPINTRGSHTGFPGWTTASPTWPQFIGSSWFQPS